MATPPAAQTMVTHILAQLARHRSSSSTRSPLFVGIQGCQGSGKTYLTSHLRTLLSSAPNSLSVLTLSIDDLYLPRQDLLALAASHPENHLLHGRGLPGTHDVALGHSILSCIRDPSLLPSSESLRLPFFDKSQAEGYGDRLSPDSPSHPYPVPLSKAQLESLDVVIVEGWMMGFLPVPKPALVRTYAIAKAEESVREAGMRMDEGVEAVGVPESERMDGGSPEEAWETPKYLEHDLDSILEVNAFLEGYTSWYGFFEVFIQILPPALSTIYRWRTQQEHHLQSLSASKVMSDKEVVAFVDRYMPAYELFLDGVRSSSQSWTGRSIALRLGQERQVLGMEEF